MSSLYALLWVKQSRVVYAKYAQCPETPTLL